MRTLLIAGEIALTVVLVAASGLLIHSLIYLETLPPGFNANNVMAGKVSLDDARYHDAAAFQHLLTASLDAMRRIPGVENAAVGLSLPYERTLNSGIKIADGKNSGKEFEADEDYVTPGYFDVLRMHLLAGRQFADSDTAQSQPVAIVN
ncbi:permease, partial [mine drainage metagenome]